MLSRLNRRERQLMIDSKVDLSAIPKHIHPASWILPLTKPLFDVEAEEPIKLEENQEIGSTEK